MNSSATTSPLPSFGRKLKRWQEDILVLLSFLALTLVLTYPVVFFLRTKLWGDYPEDNFHFLWELWYTAHALFDLHKTPFLDPDIFVPFGFNLLRNQDLSPGTVLLFSPLTHYFGEIFTYNVLVLASFTLTAFGTYLFARELWGSRQAALLAGVIVGFCTYRFNHAGGHLSIVSTQWIPFFFLYLERTLQRRHLRDAALAGLFFALSALVTWYYAFLLPLAALFYVLTRCPWQELRRSPKAFIRVSILAGLVVAVFVLPFAIPYAVAARSGAIASRPIGEAQAFAASVADYFIPNGKHLLFGKWAHRHWRAGPNGLWGSEWEVYIGMVALALALLGIAHPRRKIVRCLLITTAGCLIFSFGPGLYLTHPAPLGAGTNDVPLSPIVMPARWLAPIMGYSQIRGWARMSFFVELMLGLLAAGGLDFILNKLKSSAPGTSFLRKWIVTVVAIGLVIMDSWAVPIGMSAVTPRAVDRWLASQPGQFAFMEYPISRHAYGGPAMYSTKLTGKRIIMGNAQYPPNLAYWGELSAFPAPSTLDLLSSWGAKYVLVDETLYSVGVSFWNIYQTWDSLLAAIKTTPRLKEVTVQNGVHVYRLVETSLDDDSHQVLSNRSFEEGTAGALPGWEIIGKPIIDRTGMNAYSGNTACAVTPSDFLVSAPVAVEPGRCYRMTVRQRSNSASAKLRLQLNWKDSTGHELPPSTAAIRVVSSARQWQKSSMTVRAPAGSKYAVVYAVTHLGTTWLDDYSFKEVTDDCLPSLFVTPNPAPAPSGRSAHVAVSWDSHGASAGRVTLGVDGGAEEVIAEGATGLKMLDNIEPGRRYQLRLYADGNNASQSILMTAIETTARIAASPNPLPAGPNPATTIISWTTMTDATGEVYVSCDGGPEELFAKGGASGSQPAAWIASGSHCEFRLYSGAGSRRLLAKVEVSR